MTISQETYQYSNLKRHRSKLLTKASLIIRKVLSETDSWPCIEWNKFEWVGTDLLETLRLNPSLRLEVQCVLAPEILVTLHEHSAILKLNIGTRHINWFRVRIGRGDGTGDGRDFGGGSTVHGDIGPQSECFVEASAHYRTDNDLALC